MKGCSWAMSPLEMGPKSAEPLLTEQGLGWLLVPQLISWSPTLPDKPILENCMHSFSIDRLNVPLHGPTGLYTHMCTRAHKLEHLS